MHQKSKKKLKEKIKALLTSRKVQNIKTLYIRLKRMCQGWINYFILANMKQFLMELDQWIRRRIRMIYWRRWKRIRTKIRNLTKLGCPPQKAYEYGNTRKGAWRTAKSPILHKTITNKRLAKAGLLSLHSYYISRLGY
nr:group II intron maturase-specific domain-containing protein [Clostridium sp. 'deep sea']